MERDNKQIEQAHICSRFARSIGSYDDHAIAQQQIAANATAILPTNGQTFQRCLEIGCGTGGFTRLLQKRLPDAAWTLNDLCEPSLSLAASYCPHPPQTIVGDAESTELGTGYDLIASTSAFQWFRAPQPFVSKLAQMQKEGAILLFSTFAPGNLKEVKCLTGKGLIYPTTNDWQTWLSPFYRIETIHEEEIQLTFASPLDVLRHLKYTGVTATNNGAWTRGMQEDFCNRYYEQFSTNNNKVTLTYRPLYIMAVKQ